MGRTKPSFRKLPTQLANKRPKRTESDSEDYGGPPDHPWYVSNIDAKVDDMLELVQQDYPKPEHLCDHAQCVIVPYIEFFTNDSNQTDDNDDDDDERPQVNKRAIKAFCSVHDKMRDLEGTHLYRLLAFYPALPDLREALQNMKSYLSDEWSDTEDVFYGLPDNTSDESASDNNSSDNEACANRDSSDDEANANRAECQYAAFLRYLSERNLMHIHREFLEWLSGEVEAGRHPPVQCAFPPSVIGSDMIKFNPK